MYDSWYNSTTYYSTLGTLWFQEFMIRHVGTHVLSYRKVQCKFKVTVDSCFHKYDYRSPTC
jgi:hypothetical protein